MERAAWIEAKRRLAEERMDTLWAPIYDEDWGATINPTHRRFVERFLGRLAPRSLILDAACGTGKVWPLLLAAGHTLLGIDQSQGMLSRAHAKFPEVPVEKLALQAMSYQAAFDGILCIDALEMVVPEDWLRVLMNFRRALRPGGYLYFTVEQAGEQAVAQAYAAGRQLGLPVVYGEWAHEEGYHYYPPLARVRAWLHEAGLNLLEEGEGDDYFHGLSRPEA